MGAYLVWNSLSGRKVVHIGILDKMLPFCFLVEMLCSVNQEYNIYVHLSYLCELIGILFGP